MYLNGVSPLWILRQLKVRTDSKDIPDLVWVPFDMGSEQSAGHSANGCLFSASSFLPCDRIDLCSDANSWEMWKNKSLSMETSTPRHKTCGREARKYCELHGGGGARGWVSSLFHREKAHNHAPRRTAKVYPKGNINDRAASHKNNIQELPSAEEPLRQVCHCICLSKSNAGLLRFKTLLHRVSCCTL